MHYPGYSSSPDLANAATVSVSLIEGSRRKDSQIQEKMVLKRQYLEILRSLIIFWQDRCRQQFNHSWDCRLHIFWLYDHRNIRHRPAILEKLPSLINFWQDRRCPQQGSTVSQFYHSWDFCVIFFSLRNIRHRLFTLFLRVLLSNRQNILNNDLFVDSLKSPF